MGYFAEEFQFLPVFVLFDGLAEMFVEEGQAAQVSGVGKVEDAPVFREAVLNRRAAHGDFHFSFQLFDRPGLRRFAVFDILRLVDDNGAPVDFPQFLYIHADYAVRGEHDIGLQEDPGV